MPRTVVDNSEGPEIEQARAIAIVRLGTPWLERLLQLPEGNHVTGVHWSPDRDQVMLVITGPAMPMVTHGWAIPEIRPLCRTAQTDQAVMHIEWPKAAP